MDLLTQGLDYFQRGGFVMYILLICSCIVCTIGIERYIYFSKADSGRTFARQFYKLMMNNRIEEAQKLALDTHGDLANIITLAFKRAKKPHINILAILEVQSGISISKFRLRLYYLHIIVTMAPLLGLLGTILGMISAFSVFNLQEGQAIAITGGVGEALIATATGLCVAILALSIHSYFVHRIDRIVTEMEQSFTLIEGIMEVDDNAFAKSPQDD